MGSKAVSYPTVRRGRGRQGLLPLLVLAMLLGCMLQPSSAAAAIAPNPNPTLIARWDPCEPNTGVTVIVDDQHIGEGKIYVGCALGQQANGAEALQHAGFDVEGTKQYGLGFICRIGGEPTVAEQTCQETPGADAYWTYWLAKPGGHWFYSPVGAATDKPPLGSVQGWGFNADGGGAPRIEPMDGAGPHAFTLPPEQESSVIPTMLAREWLTGATLSEVSGIEAHTESVTGNTRESGLEQLLAQAEALAQAGVPAATLHPLAGLLAASCELHNAMVEGCELRDLYDPSQPSVVPVAAAVLGLQALGQSTESFAGLDPRATLEGMIEAATGKVESQRGGELTESVDVLARTALALARTGTLSARALSSVDLLLAQQTATGQFGPDGEQTETSTDVEVIRALAAAREQGAGVIGQSRLQAIEVALPKAGAYLESIQGQDGSVRQRENSDTEYEPDLESTAQGAAGLALAGRRQAAERAAKWISQYQVTAEYAGHGNTEAGEHTPAEALIGAFMPSQSVLKEALIYGETGGSSFEAQEATWPALLALTQAGPYGPYYAQFDQESLFFESRVLGSPTKPLTATLTNQDVRPVTITALQLTGGQSGDFQITGGNCAGRTLQPGDTCEVQVAFDPSALGLSETQLQATLAGTGQTLELPLSGTGIPAPEPQPQPKLEPKTEPGPGPPVVSPLLALTPGPAHTSDPVAGVAIERIGPARLLLKFTAPGVATVKIAHLLGKGHHRHFRTVKTFTVKASKAGALEIRLPRLAAGNYRVSIGLAGAKTIVKTLTVPRT
jgi:hypothetical protein